MIDKEWKQKYFNKCVKHLIKQGEPALCANKGCVYRTPGGQACAIGCFVSDDIAAELDLFNDSTFENPKIVDIVFSELDEEYSNNKQDFFLDLQRGHDGISSYLLENLTYEEIILETFSKIAKKHNLSLPIELAVLLETTKEKE